jgi:hypothetical protein
MALHGELGQRRLREVVMNGRESYVHVAENGKVLKRETAAQERKAEPRERP